MNNEVYSVGDGRIITLVVRETIYNLRIPSPVVSQKGRKAGDQQIVFLIGTHSRKDDSGSILDSCIYFDYLNLNMLYYHKESHFTLCKMKITKQMPILLLKCISTIKNIHSTNMWAKQYFRSWEHSSKQKKKNPHPLKAYILGEGGRQYIHSLYINMTFQRTIWGHQIGLLDEDFWGLLGQGKLFEEVNYEVMEMRCRGRPL